MEKISGIFIILLVGVFDRACGQILSNTQCCEEYCFVRDGERPQTKRFSTKTAYELAKGLDYSNHYIVPHCTPSKIWLLSRHGTRLPDAKQIRRMMNLDKLRDEIIKNYEVRKSKPSFGALCRDDLDLLKAWRFDTNITETNANYLTSQGWDDLKLLAAHYKYIFPSILDKPYSSENFLFKHTKSQRTEASFKAFADGLFGDNSWRNIRVPSPPNNDTLLAPYDNCQQWQKQDDEIDAPGSEIDKFDKSDLLNKTITDISLRLGFRYPLERKQIDTIWDTCRYEQAWYLERNSPWCTAFTPSQVSVLEYAEDLKYQFKSGYGHELNSRVMCEAVQDMIFNMDSPRAPQAVAYFTHSSAIQLFLVALGIAKDQTLLSANNFKDMERRKWRTSAIGPFAANLAAVKYNCPEDSAEPTKVIFFLNQNPVELDWCKVGLCNWSDIRREYDRYFTANCKDYYCSENSGKKLSTSFVFIIVTFLVKWVLL